MTAINLHDCAQNNRLCGDNVSMAAGKYERLDLIGSGTFGRAWLVRRVTTGREYVMKELKVSGLTERDRAHAATEVQALARCRHVNVIRYREAFLADSCESGALLCIVMEHADAGVYLSHQLFYSTPYNYRC